MFSDDVKVAIRLDKSSWRGASSRYSSRQCLTAVVIGERSRHTSHVRDEKAT